MQLAELLSVGGESRHDCSGLVPDQFFHGWNIGFRDSKKTPSIHRFVLVLGVDVFHLSLLDTQFFLHLDLFNFGNPSDA